MTDKIDVIIFPESRLIFFFQKIFINITDINEYSDSASTETHCIFWLNKLIATFCTVYFSYICFSFSVLVNSTSLSTPLRYFSDLVRASFWNYPTIRISNLEAQYVFAYLLKRSIKKVKVCTKNCEISLEPAKVWRPQARA